MKTKIAFLALLLFTSITLCGQQAKVVPMQSPQQVTAESSVNQQDMIKQLQIENQRLKEDLDKLEKDVDRYRDDVWNKSSNINSTMAFWAGLISLLVTLIVGALGVFAPLYINRRNDEKLQKQIEKSEKDLNDKIEKVEKLAQQANLAAENAKLSMYYAEAIKEKNEIKAIELYTRIIDYKEKEVGKDILLGALWNRALLFIKQGKNTDALSDYNRAIELVPNSPEAYVNRGGLLKIMELYEAALMDFNKAIELNPGVSEAYFNRGTLLNKLGKNEDALSDFNKAIKLDPDDAVTHDSKGLLLLDMNQTEEQRLYFK